MRKIKLKTIFYQVPERDREYVRTEVTIRLWVPTLTNSSFISYCIVGLIRMQWTTSTLSDALHDKDAKDVVISEVMLAIFYW